VYNSMSPSGKCGPGYRSRYSDSLRAGRSRDGTAVRVRFSHLSRLALGPTQPSIQRVPGIFPGGEAAGAWH
jgi:hypothetical protein